MTNLLDLPLDQFRGYLAEGNYPQARQDELMRAYRAKNSLSGLLDRYGEEGLEGKNVSTFFPVAGPGGMSIFDALKSGQLQTRFKDYASDALGGVIGALENPRAAYQGTLPQADFDSAAMGTGGLAMGGGGVAAGRNIGATNANASKSAGLLAASLPDPRNAGEAMAQRILEMRAAGKAGDVTDEMMAQADPQYMFNNTPLDMSEAARMARAGRFDADAYHATGNDFAQFVPSKFRGASFFGPTPIGASSGASASKNEGIGSGSNITIPVKIDASGVEGLGAYSRKLDNDFRSSLTDRVYSEAELDKMKSNGDFPRYTDWTTFFDDFTDYDALRAFRDANPDGSIPDGIIAFKPKQAIKYGPKLTHDLSGRQFAHYSEGMSEKPTSDYVKSQGNTGFTMSDESGIALAVTNPANIRSRFARFDPEFSHLSNLSAANASKSAGVYGLLGANSLDEVVSFTSGGKPIYHSGDSSMAAEAHKYGVEPQYGSWTTEIAQGASDFDDFGGVQAFLDEMPTAAWWSEQPNWIRSKVARAAGKNARDVNDEDIKRYGHLAIADGSEFEDDVFRIGEDGLDYGEGSPVQNLAGEKMKLYETPLYEYGDDGVGRYPFGIERNELVTRETIDPKFTLTGDALLQYMKRNNLANASAPVGLLAAQPSTEDELRQYLMQRGLLQ